MHIAIACGGTGGHIFPGLATARELQLRGHRVTLWMAGKDVENEAVKGWEGTVHTVPAQGFPSRFTPDAFATSWRLLRAVRRVRREMANDKPDVVLAMGSYASIGPGGAALLLRVPFLLHESNVIPGRAVRLLARWADVVGGCFDETRFYLRRRRLVITGMPLRGELIERASSQPSSGSGGVFRLLVMGGSRGAHELNERVSAAVIRLAREGLPLSVTHLTGEPDREAIDRRYREAGVSAAVIAFTRDIGGVYAATDFAVCRAGAATCAELLTFGIPSLLVPYPHAIHDHQTANARAMEKAGAADMIPERDLDVEWLVSYMRQMIRQQDRRASMAAAARARSSVNGAARLADLVEETAARKQRHG